MNPLIRSIPPSMVRLFARPYVAGDSLGSAVDNAGNLLSEKGLMTTLDLLAEGIETHEVVRQNIDTYMAMIDAVSKDPRFTDRVTRPTLSLKPSSYTTEPLEHGGDAGGARDAIWEICDYAADRDVQITVDMESHHWTDFTLALWQDLHASGRTDVGGVLQTRLNRTKNDLSAVPAGSRVRLVIGIYDEPSDIAVRDKQEMKERLLSYGKILLERGHYLEFGTHDEQCIRRFVDDVVPEVGVQLDRFEIQMLYGVPREALQRELLSRGIRVRLYMPFALGWPMAIAYLRRRLDEFPAMMFLALKNMVWRN